MASPADDMAGNQHESAQATTENTVQRDAALSNPQTNEHPSGERSPEVRCKIKEYKEIYSGNKRVLRELHKKKKVKKRQLTFAGKYTKHFNMMGALSKVELKVHSPHIQNALRSVVKSFPGQNFGGDVLFLSGNRESEALGCLFHRLKALEEFGGQQVEDEPKAHILLVVNLLKKEFGDSMQRFNAQMILSEKPCIEFRDLWMLFTPGELIFSGTGCSEAVYEVVEATYKVTHGYLGQESTSWRITAKTFCHDGKTFGYLHETFTIEEYGEARDVTKLEAYPIKHHPDEKRQRGKLLERGKKLCSLVGVQYQSYCGQAMAVSYDKEADIFGRMRVSYTQEPVQVNSRIVIDALAFAQSMSGIEFDDPKLVEAKDVTEKDQLLGYFKVPGYSLADKKWCWFMLDYIQAVDFDETAFAALILPDKQKRLIRALATKHTIREDSFDDVIKEKGKGCIFLLHGPPGVGKTATAESVADATKQPLFVLTASDLGSDLALIEAKLKTVFKLTARWNAILLIDEADVFLERRSSHDLSLNGVVPIFLRLLEYCRGVLFLTTNRIDNIDVAFQSRIHLALSYPRLDSTSREKIWKLFLERTANYDEKDWPDETIQRPAALELNGRQIKNVIRTANTLALADKKKISMQEIQDVLDTVLEFQRHGKTSGMI